MRSDAVDRHVRELIRELKWKIEISKNPLAELEVVDLKEVTEDQTAEVRKAACNRQKELYLPQLHDDEKVHRFVEAGKPDWLASEDFARIEEVDRIRLLHKEGIKQREQDAADVAQQHEDLMRALREESEKQMRAQQEIATQQQSLLAQRIEEYEGRLSVLETLFIKERLPDERPDKFDEREWRRLQLIEATWRRNEQHDTEQLN